MLERVLNIISLLSLFVIKTLECKWLLTFEAFIIVDENKK